MFKYWSSSLQPRLTHGKSHADVPSHCCSFDDGGGGGDSESNSLCRRVGPCHRLELDSIRYDFPLLRKGEERDKAEAAAVRGQGARPGHLDTFTGTTF